MTNTNEINELDPASVAPPPYNLDNLLDEIRETIRAHRAEGGRWSRPFALKLRNMVLGGTVREALEQGVSRFPPGLGVLRLVRLAPNRRRHPATGEMVVTRRERARLRFVMGVAVQRLLGYRGYYTYKPKSGVDPLAGVQLAPAAPDPATPVEGGAAEADFLVIP